MPPSISLVTAPLTTLRVLLRVCVRAARARAAALAHLHAAHVAALVCATACAAWWLVAPPSPAAARARDELVFAAYWALLGVLSSIGLGSGLHTFVLYLGPHIVRVAAAAVAQGGTSFSARIAAFGALPPPSWDGAGLARAISPQ